MWTAFAAWRHSRPFWAGLWCIIGGAIIAVPPVSVIKFLLVSGTIITVAILVGVLVVLMGLFLWFLPQNRHIAGSVAMALSVASLVTSNLGGFLIGMLLGIVGGAMGFAWTPTRPAGEQGQIASLPPARRRLPFGRR